MTYLKQNLDRDWEKLLLNSLIMVRALGLNRSLCKATADNPLNLENPRVLRNRGDKVLIALATVKPPKPSINQEAGDPCPKIYIGVALSLSLFLLYCNSIVSHLSQTHTVFGR